MVICLKKNSNLKGFHYSGNGSSFERYQINPGVFIGEVFAVKGVDAWVGRRSANVSIIERVSLAKGREYFCMHHLKPPYLRSSISNSSACISCLDDTVETQRIFPSHFQYYFVDLSSAARRERMLEQDVAIYDRVKMRLYGGLCFGQHFVLELIRYIETLVVRAGDGLDEQERIRLVESIESELVHNIVNAHEGIIGSKSRANSRTRVVRRTLDAFFDSDLKSTTLLDVSFRASVSIRAMQQAFREQLGITPKEFLTRLRLNAIRNEIISRGNATTIQSLAHEHGVYHMGNFSKYYFRFFGETPSETKRRAKA